MTRTDVNAVAAAGAGKLALARAHPGRYLSRAAMAGAFIMVGSLISSLSAAWFYTDQPAVAKLLGAFTFSAALILIVLLGGELFTGANFVMGVSLYERRVSFPGALRVWLLCYVGNFIGIFLLALLVAGSGASGGLLSSYLAQTIPAKLAGTWYALLLKGVLCNFLVCVGVFSGFKLKSEAGKCIVIAAVITTFVLAGFEHSIANMAAFSLYALLVPGPDFAGIAWNMLWVTLGNMIGGAVVLGLPLWLSAEPDGAA
ncbi:MAG: formate/nitrite transporter family protein [Oscillospiraceae bacterium]